MDVAHVAGTGPALLASLASNPPEELDPTGEIWLNLIGVALDAGPPYDAAHLVDELRTLDGVELRRHLLGRYAWSWCYLAGEATIEAAAAGDPDAAARLLAHPRYYGGRAEEALSVLLPLSPEETRRRILRAVEAAPVPSEAVVAAASDEAEEVLDSLPDVEAVERLTGGYRYVPEPEAERVVLIPHVARGPGLALAQHREARVVLYRARVRRTAEERLVALGRALADSSRIEVLSLLGSGVTRVGELVRRTGLSRSTIHHHLAQLRDAGLITLEGNARAYRYHARVEAADELAVLLAELVGEGSRA
jgi:DNA-binding transcriptional ArsR family regulator